LLDNRDKAIMIFWLVFWIMAWLGHRPWRRRSDKTEPAPVNQQPLEYVKIPRAAQLLFGLPPTTRWLRLRVAIAQCLAVLAAIVNIVLKHLLGISQPRRLSEMMLISLFAYHLLSFSVSLVLDKLGPQPEQTEDRT
jgi:hypothetical protein